MTQGSSNRALLFGKPMEVHVDLWKFPYHPIHSSLRMHLLNVQDFLCNQHLLLLRYFLSNDFPLFGWQFPNIHSCIRELEIASCIFSIVIEKVSHFENVVFYVHMLPYTHQQHLANSPSHWFQTGVFSRLQFTLGNFLPFGTFHFFSILNDFVLEFCLFLVESSGKHFTASIVCIQARRIGPFLQFISSFFHSTVCLTFNGIFLFFSRYLVFLSSQLIFETFAFKQHSNRAMKDVLPPFLCLFSLFLLRSVFTA